MFKSLKEKGWFKPLLYVVLGVVIGVIFSMISAKVAHWTGDVAFCSVCHTMTPMVEAYKQDVHGGNNQFGFRASCSDCHLPQDSIVGYYWVKGISGLKDTLGEIFGSYDKDFWEKNRANRENFVYTSGCLKCHSNYLDIKKNEEAIKGHRLFKQGNLSCVSCHRDVGHKDLSSHLEKFYKK